MSLSQGILARKAAVLFSPLGLGYGKVSVSGMGGVLVVGVTGELALDDLSSVFV